MNCSFELTESDVVEAMKIHAKPPKRLLSLSIIAIPFLLFVATTRHKMIALFCLVGGLLGYFIHLLVIVPMSAKRQFKENAAVRKKTAMEVSTEGIVFKSDSGLSNLKWNEIYGWKYEGRVVLLYISSKVFHTVPVRAISKESEFIKILSDNIGEKFA